MDRYEEAIIKMRDFVERYKYYTTSEGGNMYKDLINIFPELAESEDEKIRKELLEHCKNQAKPYIQTGNECPQIQSWIAWLEKQNSNVANKEYWRGYREGKQEILDKYAELEKEGEYYLREKQGNTQKEASYTYEAETGNGNIKALVTEKVQLPKFKVGDEIKTSNEESLTITKIDEKGYWSKDLLICGFDDAAKWELVEQKPAWSEKDAGYIKDLISYFSQNEKLGNTKEDVIAWLKSLKERVQL